MREEQQRLENQDSVSISCFVCDLFTFFLHISFLMNGHSLCLPEMVRIFAGTLDLAVNILLEVQICSERFHWCTFLYYWLSLSLIKVMSYAN